MPWHQIHAPSHQQAPRWLHLYMGPCIVLFNSFILSGSHSISRIDWKEMIEISRKVEEPNGLFGSTGWRLPKIVTPLCEKPQTTVTTATHVLSHILSPWPQSVTQWACVLVTSTKVVPGMNPFPVAVYRPDSVPKTLSGFWGAAIPSSNHSFLALLTYQRSENIKTLPANPNPTKVLNLTHF